MKIIVTGGAGFIGSHLVDRLLNDGHEIIVWDNFSTGSMKNLDHIKKGEIEIHHYTVGSDNFMIPRCVDAMFHLAALPRIMLSIEKPFETHQANVVSTLAALEFCKQADIKKFVYASSSSVYGDQTELPLHETMEPLPLSPYALHKLIGEQYCRLYHEMYGIKTRAMRFFNVYGSRMALKGEYKLVFGNWIEQIKAGEHVKIFGDGRQTRDFTHVSDVVDALILAMKWEVETDAIFNVGSGNETSINELARLFGYAHEYIEARPYEEYRKQADTRLIRSFLGWEPKVTIEEGVKLLKKEYAI